jgi:hypothetical protein
MKEKRIQIQIQRGCGGDFLLYLSFHVAQATGF